MTHHEQSKTGTSNENYNLVSIIDSNFLHHQFIRQGETKRLPYVILSRAKNLARWALRPSLCSG